MPARLLPRVSAHRVGSLVALLLAANAHAGIIWNEPVQGDFSDDRFAPTQLSVEVGSNLLFGNMRGGNDQGLDRDYFSITIPEGAVLTQITLAAYLSEDFAAFIAIQPGAIFPDDPETVAPGDLLGWAHFGPDQEFTDLLALMGSNGQGFDAPLPAGTYTFWGQQVGAFTNYDLDFVVEEVPAPSSFVLIGGPLAVLLRRRR